MMIYPKSLEKPYLKRINHVIDYSRNKSPYYKKLFKKIDLPRKIINLSQFESIPITFRKDLEKRNEEFVTIPRGLWADVVTTSGTTGNPIYIPFTKKDISKNAYFISKKFSTFGLGKDDMAYITIPIEQSMWIGGLSVWLGCLEIGACSLRAGNVAIDKHIEFIGRFNPTVIFGLPSFILRLGEEIKTRKPPRIIKPRLIVTFGENVMNRDFSRNALGTAIERLWGAKVISGYCSTEVSPGFECVFQTGHHILSEMAYVEIVDPKSLKVLKPGEDGLVVITHFGREGLPLIRYANGDLSFLAREKCRCARPTARLGPILGRIDEMVKIKGVNLYPSQLEAFFLGIPFICDFFIELFTDNSLCDKIKISVKFRVPLSNKDKKGKISYLEKKIKDSFNIKIDVKEMAVRKNGHNSRIKNSHIIDKSRK
jgi:phenylacetate-CoA ligase